MLVTERAEAARPAWDAISGEPDGLIHEVDVLTTDIIKATVVVFDPGGLDALLYAFRRLGLTPETASSAALPGATFVNVNSPGVDKGTALAYAADHLGLPLAQAVAVGDALNDLSMLSVAGTAVAMGQAPAAVQDAAHLVVPEVDQDGVAHALRAAAEWRLAKRPTPISPDAAR